MWKESESLTKEGLVLELLHIDAELFKKGFLAGAKKLEAKKEWINELNVFPVPDGDTGTNMTMTIMSAVKEVMMLENPDMKSLCKAISSGSLRGARGNSGVILSQLLRGFTKVIQEVEYIDTKTLAKALQKATETAYKAVMKPKEGTILTVAKGMSDKAVYLAEETDDILVMLEEIAKEGDLTLERTPELLPVLKQAGVVDSGGQGLMVVINGCVEAIMGKEIDLSLPDLSNIAPIVKKEYVNTEHLETSDIKFGYCTEFIIHLEKEFSEEDEDGFKEFLSSIGDSIVCVADDEVVKIHVHTNDPGLAIQKALGYGSLSKMKIDNMREEHNERLIKDAMRIAKEQAEQDALKKKKKVQEPRKPYGFISVSVGEGLSEIFTGIGIDHLIEGGQTMNPSTDDILQAIDEVNADIIYILPNNKNIILAANQAATLTKDKQILVVPSKTIPQGIAAVIRFMPDLTPEENLKCMISEMERVKSAQVTYAVRNTNIDGFEIAEGDIMVIGDNGMLEVGKDIESTTIEGIGKILEDTELVSIYYGAGIQEKEASALCEKLENKYPDVEFELQYGGQPVYYYMISAE